MAFYHQGLRSRARQFAPAPLARSVAAALDESTVFVDWVNRGAAAVNWGDKVAPVLVEWLSGRSVVPARDVQNFRNRVVYTTIGSMLGTVEYNELEVWGSGLIDSTTSMRVVPSSVHAVRGPLTHARLVAQGIDCPPIFGDPAWIYPSIYTPERTNEFELGIIPHFKEKDLEVVKELEDSGRVHLIDIEGSLEGVVEQINRCRAVASSSLHGLVVTDAYGIPTNWITMSDRPAGDGFKFRDYLLATRSGREHALHVTVGTGVEEILDHVGAPVMNANFDAFIDACPFKQDSLEFRWL